MPKILKTIPEYMLDQRGDGPIYQGVGVRYFDLYDDGSTVLREGWSKWTGMIDVSLAIKPGDDKIPNVAGIRWGTKLPNGTEVVESNPAGDAAIAAMHAWNAFYEKASDAMTLGVSFNWSGGEPMDIRPTIQPSYN